MYSIFVMTGKISPMMATKACKFASVRRSLNLERLSGEKSLASINSECTLPTLTVALTGAADMFVNSRARRFPKNLRSYFSKLLFKRHTMQNAPAADRNKDPILKVLQTILPADLSGKALEIASGTGQHVTYFAQSFTNLVWQPSDLEKPFLGSISAYINHYKLQNVKQPICVDITTPVDQWKDGQFDPNSYDLIYNANMIHISPWATAIGLFEAAGYLLKQDGFLLTYGPYAVDGVLEPESNVNFDRTLKSRDSEWGIRDIKDLKVLAENNGLELIKMIEMPANNKSLIWRKKPV